MPMAKSTKGRIKIKPFSKPPKLPPDFYESTSKQLLEATSSILKDVGHQAALQHSYNSVVNLVSHQFGPRLYHDLVQEFKATAKLVLPADTTAAAATSSDNDNNLLTFLSQQYPKYVDYLLLVRHVFMALDRPYVWEDGQAIKRTSQSSTVLEVGLCQFHARLVEFKWDDDAYEAWWKLLWNESFMKQSSSVGILSSTMNMWKDLGVARDKMKQTQPRLQTSLSQLSIQWQANQPYSAESFLQYVYQQWNFVSMHWTFLPKTWLRTLIEMHLLEPHLNTNYLLQTLDITHLQHCQKLWHLAGRMEGGLQRVITVVCALIKAKGIAIVQQTQPPPTAKIVISSLLELYSQVKALQACVGDIPLKPVWADIMNSTPLVAEWLAKYVDLEFKNFKSETSLGPLLYLFTHLQAKDIFEAFYKKDLAKRLLLNKVHSMDLERQFVSLLKTECGTGYTSKMEGMFQDMEWSRESLKSYKDSAPSTDVDMEVQILTTGYWPVYPQFKSLVLPPELLQPQDHFWNYYKTKYQGRKIVWQYALGNCTLKFTGGLKTYDFIASLSQSLVLLCFNERQQWTLPALMQRIGFDDRDEMERVLISMTQGKDQFRILARKRSKTPKTETGPVISDDDIFGINEKFSSNMRRIKLPNVLKKETKEERDKVVETVDRDRLYLIDAVLVRILKARKTILHQQLIPQVLEQVKVPAQPADIKKRIESLIEREYMERDEKDRNRYNYLA